MTTEVHEFQQLLTSVPVSEWMVEQIIVLDWYDGPIAGVCELSRPRCSWSFRILGQRFDKEPTDRLYRVYGLAPGAVSQVRDALKDFGPPKLPMWVPVSKISTDTEGERVNEVIRSVMQRSVPTGLIIRSINMETFLGYWYDMTGEYD